MGDRDICNHYSSEFIWKIVPLIWREWWFDYIVLQFPAYYNSISITEPQFIFMDRTKDLETWNEGIKSQELSYIANVCNQFLLPNVLYPWGCSEVTHKVGYVDLDTAIQQFIQKRNLSISYVSRLSKIEHTHNDYLLEFNNYYDMCIHNTDWKVLPTISFVYVYPHVLT